MQNDILISGRIMNPDASNTFLFFAVDVGASGHRFETCKGSPELNRM